MRIALVNDSPTAQVALRRVIESERGLEVAWQAVDGEEAVAKCRIDPPDMILMDLIMPVMNGVEATRRIMQECPCPILIVTASVDSNIGAVFEAMGAGAWDAVSTPPLGAPEARKVLLEKIRSVASISEPAKSAPLRATPRQAGPAGACVLIGCSAGGPAALMEILPALPRDLPAAVVVIQHVDVRFAGELATWLNEQSTLPVRLATENDEPQPGQILIADGGRHLVFERNHRLHYTITPQLSYEPSADVFFKSAVQHGPRRLMGALLTGMGKDGAVGLKTLRDSGHFTLAQDEKTSAIYGMPRAAAEIQAACEILALPQIASRISLWANQNA